MKKKAKSEYHHGGLKEAVAETSLKLLGKGQEPLLTLRELGKRAGVSHAAIYRHFRSKTDILAYLAQTGFTKLDALFQERSGLIPLGRAYVEFALENPGYFKAMFHPELGDKSKHPKLNEIAKTAFGRLVHVIDLGMKEGRYHGSSAEVLAIIAWSAVHGLSSLFLDMKVDRDNVIDEFLYRIEKGFLSK